MESKPCPDCGVHVDEENLVVVEVALGEDGRVRAYLMPCRCLSKAKRRSVLVADVGQQVLQYAAARQLGLFGGV